MFAVQIALHLNNVSRIIHTQLEKASTTATVTQKTKWFEVSRRPSLAFLFSKHYELIDARVSSSTPLSVS